jgi:serine phosphatase RsbU (regulator of sigma subunit)
MLTSESYFDEYLKSEYFILYKPKDIVAGDFYWAQFAHNKFYIATADCTGHGVPGAFMSLLNIGFLNENVIERGIKEPSLILDEQRKKIIKALNPKGNENSKDGMDCILCVFDFAKMQLDFAAANNPLWIIRDNELLEFKADKQPVGLHNHDMLPFTQQTVQLQKGDIVYTATDGFADQFSDSQKKMTKKRFKEQLLAATNLPMNEQKEKLDAFFETWKGITEQIDDVLVIGIKI